MTEIILVAILLAVAVISASQLLSCTVWHRCPKCRRYHSGLGISDTPPFKGHISTEQKVCEVCK